MHRSVGFISAVALTAATLVAAQEPQLPATPLASKHFAYPTEIVSGESRFQLEFVLIGGFFLLACSVSSVLIVFARRFAVLTTTTALSS